MHDSPTKLCPACGRPIPDDAPEGCCPWCLVSLAVEDTLVAEGELGADSSFPRRFGDYELLEKIADGASGRVYRARHVPLNRQVAVKLIHSGQFASAEERRRFQLEAEAAATLDHPNIVPVYEVGEHEGWPFLAMKLVEGRSLAERLPRAAQGTAARTPPYLTATESATLVATITRAVHHAHQRGILHRDLKPANVLLDEAGQPHLTDFGLAKWLKRDLAQTVGPALLGTPQYMSPEQAAGRAAEVTVASDVFSLGAMLYELVCGKPPFRGQTIAETLQRVLEANPRRPRAVNPAVDRDLETIILKCLDSDPGRRYPSANALAEDLEHWQRHEPIAARRASWLDRTHKWVRRNPAIATLCAFMFAVLVAGISVFMHAQRADAQVRGVSAIAKVQLAHESLALLRPHDALPLLAGVVRKTPDIEVARDALLAELTQGNFPLPLAELPCPGGSISHVQFSPDGRYLATTSVDGAVAVWDTLTNGPALPPLPHGGEVISAVFSPDGGRIASCSLDGPAKGTAKVWEFPSGRLLATIQHTGAVYSVRFSPDGQRLVTASADQRARVSDARTGESLFELRSDSSGMKDACFSSDGTLLLTVADRAQLWDARTGQPHGSPLTNRGSVNLACFSPRGERVLTAASDGFLRLWDTAGTSLLREWFARTNGISHIEFSPDGTRILTAAPDNTARVWDANTGEQLVAPMVHVRWVDFAHFSPDGSKIVTGSRDELFRLWNATNGTLCCAPMRGHCFTSAADFSPDGQRLATTSALGAPALWDIRPGAAQPLVLPHTAAVVRAEFDANGLRIVTASCDGTARVWDALTGAQLTRPLAHAGPVNLATLNHRGDLILTASDDRSARLWDSRTGDPRSPPLWHTGEVRVACFDPQGRRFATAATDGHARVWDVATARVLYELPWASPTRPWNVPISSAQFTPDGNALVLGCMDNTLRVWDLTSTNGSARVLLQLTGPVVGCAISPDGQRVAAVSWLPETYLADLATGALLAPALRHEDMVFHVAFSRDGRAFATSGYDGTTRLWDGFTGATLVPPLRHNQLVYWSDFSPDGRRVVTASMDATAQVWNSATGLPIGPALHHASWVRSARFSPDGQRIVTACDDGKARIWEVPSPVDPPPDWFPALAEALVGQRIGHNGVIREVPARDFLQLRQQLLTNSGTNLWARWGRWFATDRASRPPSPSASPAR